MPLFPQYSSATTASVFDAIGSWSRSLRDLPSFTFIRSFPDHPGYIAALARSVRDASVDASAETPLVISFHGIPQKYVDEKGDPYARECEAAAPPRSPQ